MAILPKEKVAAAAPLKPTATAVIEPIGSRTATPRPHAINLSLTLSAIDAAHADKGQVAAVARKALAMFPTTAGEVDRRRFGDLTIPGRIAKTGVATTIVTGVEGQLVWPSRPDDAAVDELHAILAAEGYRVTVREKRECAEDGCTSEASVDWHRRLELPVGWYSAQICGKHSYRLCAVCNSLYVLDSERASGQSPSVHCEVCGEILVEWGSSKLWSAQLITRGQVPEKRPLSD
jgi:hypothetical protein